MLDGLIYSHQLSDLYIIINAFDTLVDGGYVDEDLNPKYSLEDINIKLHEIGLAEEHYENIDEFNSDRDKVRMLTGLWFTWAKRGL